MMKITCICPTHGRITKLAESISCFLRQDCHEAVLLVYNFHEQPIRLDDNYKDVIIINEPHQGNVHEMWKRALQLVSSEFIRPWYDDDLNMPWAVSQGLEEIGYDLAFKPQFFYCLNGGYNDSPLYVTKTSNVAEGSMTIRTDHAIECGLHPNDMLLPSGLVCRDVEPSWVFRWGDGSYKSEAISRDLSADDRDKIWRANSQDIGDGVVQVKNTNIDVYYDLVNNFRSVK